MVSFVIRGKLSSSELKCGNCKLGASSMSIIESKPVAANEVVSCFNISLGCSNMLKERRNCFLGRCSGLDGLRTCPTIGEPLPRRLAPSPQNGCLNFGGPIGSGTGECADCGRFSPWGEDAKHSSADINDGWGNEGLLPNLKGGQSTRADLSETADVVNPLARDSDGRSREDLRRLQ